MSSIDTKKITTFASSISQLKTSSLDTYVQQIQSRNYANNEIERGLQQLRLQQSILSSLVHKTSSYFLHYATAYEGAEVKLKRAMESTTTLSKISHSKLSDSTVSNNPFKKEVMKFTKRYHNSISENKNLIGYIQNGVCAGVFAGVQAVTYTAKKDYKYLHGDAGLILGKATFSGDAKATLFEDKKIRPQLDLEADVYAALAQAKAAILIGNSHVFAQGEASVGVGVVTGSAKAVINKDEITLKADVGAAAIRGEVKGSFSLFGLKITATGSGEIGGVGAGVEYSKKKGEFTFGTRASFLAGLGFKIKVNY